LSLNVVTDFGADPSGATDSTVAFQMAAVSLKNQLRGVTSASGLVAAAPSLVIPCGRYKVSDEIVFDCAYLRVQSDRAMIQQMTAGKRTFVCPGMTDFGVCGVQFIGGLSSIWLGNSNVNGTQFWIDDCRFESTTGPAVKAESQAQSGILSAQLSISRSRWRGCYSALDTACDQTQVHNNSWVSWTNSVPVGTACMTVRRGYLQVDDCQLIPTFSVATSNYWIESFGSVYANRTKFGGENAGIPILVHRTNPTCAYPFQGDTVLFRDSQLSCGPGGNQQSAVVTLDGGLPLLTRFDACHSIVEGQWIRDAGSLSASLAALGLVNKLSTLKVQFGQNMAWPVAASFPAALTPYLVAG